MTPSAYPVSSPILGGSKSSLTVSGSNSRSVLLLALVLLIGACIPQTSAFATVRHASFLTRSGTTAATVTATASTTSALSMNTKDDDFSDFPPEEGFPGGADADYKGDIDWDGEWKKVVKSQGNTVGTSGGVGSGSNKAGQDRPGKDFYKSDAEIAAIRAANTATKRVQKVVSSANIKLPTSLPTIRSLQGDWKFWIGILAVLSIGVSLISAAGQGGPPVEESYFI
jgi:hypothetical protein